MAKSRKPFSLQFKVPWHVLQVFVNKMVEIIKLCSNYAVCWTLRTRSTRFCWTLRTSSICFCWTNSTNFCWTLQFNKDLCYYRVVFFNWTPPKFSKYKILLWLLTLRDIPGQFAWDPVLRKFRGGPVKKTPCSSLSPTSSIIWVKWDNFDNFFVYTWKTYKI